MSRITDTERGARMAASMACAHLDAYFSPALLPHQLTPDEFELWASIDEAAELAIADAAALRAARAELRA